MHKNSLRCPKCGKQFKLSNRLDAHMRQHYGLKVNYFVFMSKISALLYSFSNVHKYLFLSCSYKYAYLI